MKTNMVFFYSCLLVFISCTHKQQNIFPKEKWLTSTPEEQGIDAGQMDAALDYLASKSKHNKNKEVLIIRNGYQIFAGENVDSTHNIWSCSKTFTSTVLGLLVDDGEISLGDKAASYEPLLKKFYPSVTFRYFTTMTSGYSAKGRSRWNDENEDWSWTVYEPEEPLFPAGEAYAYWDEAQMMFGRVLTQILQKPMKEFLQERVTDKIGMGEWKWSPEKDLNGIPINNGCTNVRINARQFARWGWLFLNEGNWNGEQLISKEYVKMATSVQVPNTIPVANTDRKSTIGPGCYGFNWWVNGKKANGAMKLPGAPEGTYFASGLNNNKCLVIPQWNMVIVRMGQDGHPDEPDMVYGTFLKMMKEAIH
jgi:CubicO group peptidase (beta-lactamase class C family)